MADSRWIKVSVETFPELAGVEPNFHSAYDAVKSIFVPNWSTFPTFEERQARNKAELELQDWRLINKNKFILFDSVDPYLGYVVQANGVIKGTNMIGQLIMYFRDLSFSVRRVWMPQEKNPGWTNLLQLDYAKISSTRLFAERSSAKNVVQEMYANSKLANEQTILQTIILGLWAGMDPSLPGTIVSATTQDKARALKYLFARVSDPQTNEDLRLRKILLADERVELKELIPALRNALVGFPSEDDYGPNNALVDLLQTPAVMELLTGDTHSIFVEYFAYDVMNEGYSVEDALDRQFLYLEQPLY